MLVLWLEFGFSLSDRVAANENVDQDGLNKCIWCKYYASADLHVDKDIAIDFKIQRSFSR